MADRTNEFIQFVNSRVVGRTVSQGFMTFKDQRDRFGNGYKIDADGEATIHTCTGTEGKAEKLDIAGHPEYNVWHCDLKLTYRYKSTTHGNKQIYALGKMTGEHPEWKSLHPNGTIIVSYISLPGDQLRITVQFFVDADHDDNPGHFVRDHVVTHFRSLFKQFGQEFTGTSISDNFLDSSPISNAFEVTNTDQIEV